ncbi:MAG: heavy-metal-associated domain-containing protein [Thiobacillus sp.]|nr:heavy-metal-associated domain-containing protein [Thiobacillus sp.]
MYQFQVDGMGCSRCVNKITQSIQAHDPAAVVQADLDAGRISVATDAPADVVCEIVAKLGYRVRQLS